MLPLSLFASRRNRGGTDDGCSLFAPCFTGIAFNKVPGRLSVYFGECSLQATKRKIAFHSRNNSPLLFSSSLYFRLIFTQQPIDRSFSSVQFEIFKRYSLDLTSKFKLGKFPNSLVVERNDFVLVFIYEEFN